MSKTYAAPAKINLFLHVTGRRDDGYHALNTLISFIDLADVLHVQKSDAYALSVDGPFAAHAPSGDENLVTRAVRALESASGRRANLAVTLTKNLPAGAGLGGGSADAAAMMHALNAHWGNPFTLPQLQATGLTIGAELPVCLAGGAQFVSGIGEIVRPAKIPTFDAVVVWPGKTLATKDVFKVFSGHFSRPVVLPNQITLEWLQAQRNDLSDAAVQLQPAVRAALAATGGQMSGSGSAVFKICDDAASAKETAAKLAAAHPEWWVKPCRVNS